MLWLQSPTCVSYISVAEETQRENDRGHVEGRWCRQQTSSLWRVREGATEEAMWMKPGWWSTHGRKQQTHHSKRSTSDKRCHRMDTSQPPTLSLTQISGQCEVSGWDIWEARNHKPPNRANHTSLPHWLDLLCYLHIFRGLTNIKCHEKGKE